MKKLLQKRTMFLVALLVSICMPVAAQTDMSGAALNGTTVYYIQNAATGLFIKYGCTWGFDAAEGRAGHPFMITANGDGTYALSSVGGYFGSDPNIGPYIDRAKAESKWTLTRSTNDKVANGWILLDDAGRALASQGQDVGQLGMATFNSGDLLQSWVFMTESQFRNSVMTAASTDNPVDVSQLIKASSFDIADGQVLKDVEDDFGDIPLDGKVLNVNGLYQTYSSYWTNFFDRNTSDGNTTFDGFSRFNWHSYVRSGDPNSYNGVGIIHTGTSDLGFLEQLGNAFGASNGSYVAGTISQSITLPAGTYYFSFEGFYNYQMLTYEWDEELTLELWKVVSDTTESDAVSYGVDTYKPTVTFNGQTFNLVRNENIDVQNKLNPTFEAFEKPGERAAIEFRDYDNYIHEYTFTLTQQTTVTISINKPASLENTVSEEVTKRGLFGIPIEKTVTKTFYPAWICLDNFTLIYYGNKVTSGAEVDPAQLYYSKIKDYLTEVQGWVDLLNEEGQNAFAEEIAAALTFDDTNKIVYINGENGQVKVDTEQLYYITLQIIIEAYKAALLAHNEALENDDFVETPIIINPSFETGDFSGWSKVDVISSNGYTNKHENCIASSTSGSPLTQTIAQLPNGLYKLTGYVTSEPGNTVFLTANSYHKGVVAESANTLKKVELDFLVVDNVVTIGVVGGSAVNGGENMYYYAPGGCAFKADNFSLQYICDLNNGRLFMALKEATDAITGFDVYGQDAIAGKLDSYQEIYNGKTASAAHSGEVFSHLQTAAKAQRTIGADMTYAIKNHSFERGSMDGWSVPHNSSETGVFGNRAVYSTYVTDSEGAYLFNTWWQGVPLTQTVSGLPNGNYTLEVIIASGDSNNDATIYLLANDQKNGVNPPSNGKIPGDFSLDFEVTDGNATIGVVGGNDDDSESSSIGTYNENGHWWYKADNFRLTLKDPSQLVLKETDKVIPEFSEDDKYKSVKVQRNVKAGTWSTFVVPFDMDYKNDSDCPLYGWTVKELTNSVVNGDRITLTFTEADEIQAGVPYMIRHMEQSLSEIEITDVENGIALTSEKGDVSTDHVVFTGVYTNGYVPEGDYFISGNKFYKAADNTNTLKGFRAYFDLQKGYTSYVRGLDYRIDEEGTGIDSMNNEEVKVVGIYNLNGIRLDDMQEGVNILHMSDGTTMKVIIK